MEFVVLTVGKQISYLRYIFGQLTCHGRGETSGEKSHWCTFDQDEKMEAVSGKETDADGVFNVSHLSIDSLLIFFYSRSYFQLSIE